MSVCGATTEAGTACKRQTTGGLCAAHDPARAAERSEAARRAGKMRWSEGVATLKREIRAVVEDARAGNIAPGVAAVVFQGYRLWRELENDSRDAHALDELAAEIEELKRDHEKT
jgi:hypothetical protein